MAGAESPGDALESAALAKESIPRLIPYAWLPRGPALGSFAFSRRQPAVRLGLVFKKGTDVWMDDKSMFSRTKARWHASRA